MWCISRQNIQDKPRHAANIIIIGTAESEKGTQASSALHLIRVCPVLHGKCGTCKARGHTAAMCDPARAAVARGRFEMMADRGMYTSKRREDPRWGYEHLADYDPADVYFPYDELTALPVAQVPMAVNAIAQASDPLGLESGN